MSSASSQICERDGRMPIIRSPQAEVPSSRKRRFNLTGRTDFGSEDRKNFPPKRKERNLGFS
jgi:hypothetical protein